MRGSLPLLASLPVFAWAQIGGFLDARIGSRLQGDAQQDEASIREVRLQGSGVRYLGPVDAEFKADLLYDDLAQDRGEVDPDTGAGWLDVRVASLAGRPADWLDLKIGRQVLTWGTGDLLFINDLFPKDWVSFFNGRDAEYLKAPSDALWAASYFGEWTLDLVWTPRFDADRFLQGDRISFYPFLYNADAPLPSDVPDDGEFALRLSRKLGAVEAALYGYHGFWKSPGGFSPEGVAVFPELSVYGATALFPLAGGLMNLEGGFYDSREDRDGSDPGVNNSEIRALSGYTRELARNFTMGVQAYVEWMRDYAAYKESLPPGQPARDEARQVTSLRLTRLLMGQNLILSGFVYLSPTDEDGYLRASAEYKWSDTLATTLGSNLFFGAERQTFFGQLEDNSNLYLAVRRSF
jgi:hypothetical protein